MSTPELKVASATLDADGSGDISFSEFYAWLAPRDGSLDGGGGDDLSDVDGGGRSCAEGSTVGTRRSGGSISGSTIGMGLSNTLRSGFVKVGCHIQK